MWLQFGVVYLFNIGVTKMLMRGNVISNNSGKSGWLTSGNWSLKLVFCGISGDLALLLFILIIITYEVELNSLAVVGRWLLSSLEGIRISKNVKTLELQLNLICKKWFFSIRKCVAIRNPCPTLALLFWFISASQRIVRSKESIACQLEIKIGP